MKRIFKVFFALLLAFAFLGFVGCNNSKDPTKEKTVPAGETKEEAKIDFSQTEVSLKVGETFTFPALEGVAFLCNDKTISLDKEARTITAVKAGTATVTLYLKDNPSVKLNVTITIEDLEASLVFDETKLEIPMGSIVELEYTATNLDESLIKFASLDETIVSCEGNMITAESVGVTKINVTVKGHDELNTTIIVVVKGVPSIEIDAEASCYVEGTVQLEATLEYITGTVTWTTSDATIATVDANGLVTGVSEGTAYITASVDELSVEVEVTVLGKPIKITGPSECYLGKTITLIAELEGYSGDVVWESGDTMVATVDANGLVTGVSIGTVSISVTMGTKSMQAEINVVPEPTITIIGKTTVFIGRTIQLEAVLEGFEGEVTWAVTNESVMTISSDGLVTGLASGIAYVTCTSGNVEAKVKVDCIVEPDQVVLEYNGGVSEELYRYSATAVTQLVVDNYNYNEGAFWSSENYAKYIFIGDNSHNPGATFSDRIYIAKTGDDPYYKIIGIQTSGTSSWPSGAQYVISISSSYKDYRTNHNEVLKLEEGQIVLCDIDLTKITKSNVGTFRFFNAKTTAHEVTFSKQNFQGLPTPTRLGYTFEGWVDSNGTVVTEITEIKGSIELEAKWFELNPVTNLVCSGVPKVMVKGETKQVVVLVLPDDAFFKDVYYKTSNPDIVSVSASGLLTAVNAGEATITIYDILEKIVKTYTITVNPKPSIDLVFSDGFTGVMEVDENAQAIPEYFGNDADSVSFEYSSSNTEVLTIDENGYITAVGAGEALVKVVAKPSGKEATYEISYNVTVKGNNPSDRLDEVLELLIANNHAQVSAGNICKYNDGTNRYYEATYGSVNNYLFADYVVDRSYAETARNNSGGHKDRTAWHGGVEFVTVHDTATLSGNVQSIASYMATGGTSIHYTTGNKQILQVVPEEYIAYHAGDGTGVQFQWYASGVMASGVDPYDWSTYPKFDLIKDGSTYYFSINGQKSKIAAPTGNGSRTISNPSKANLPDLGPVWKIVNGEYYLGTTWVDFSQMAIGCIGSHGGNNNSIGIEMCVSTSANNQFDTYMRTAQLVADICIRNNLDLTRVKQHNTWTGKNCPQCLRAGGNWWEFMDMVRVEYIMMKDYDDITVELTTNSDIIDSTGLVVKAPETTTVVEYTITVSDGINSKSVTLQSIVPGTTTWSQWNGTYKSSLIWNGGLFSINRNDYFYE